MGGCCQMRCAENSEAWPDARTGSRDVHDWGVSIRGAGGALQFDVSTFHYKSRRTDQAAVERRIKEIAETRLRYVYRRVHALLRREVWVINMKKTRRIYNELGLQLRVITPFLMGISPRIHIAVFCFIAGVIPPMPMLGRSLLYVHIHSVA